MLFVAVMVVVVSDGNAAGDGGVRPYFCIG